MDMSLVYFWCSKDFLIPFKAKSYVGMGGSTNLLPISRLQCPTGLSEQEDIFCY